MKTAVFLVSIFAVVFASSQDATVTLQDGPSRSKGRVEIALGGDSLRQVCTADFDSDDTDALCQAAGFQDSTASVSDYGMKGGLEFMRVKCSSGTCEYTPESDGYSCAEKVLGLDCSPTVGTTGSVGLEAGIIAGILICIVAVVGIVLGLSACLYRNDLIPCFQNTAIA